jgi:hypothetical protein
MVTPGPAVTHALTMNGHVSTEVKGRQGSAEDVVRHRLSLLDGVERYSLNLWRLPDGVSFDRVDLDDWPREYVQAAGSQAAMTVEVRELVDGQIVHDVIGLAEPAYADDEDSVVEITWDGHVSLVRRREALTGFDGAEVFVEYLRTGRLSDRYTRRRLNTS